MRAHAHRLIGLAVVLLGLSAPAAAAAPCQALAEMEANFRQLYPTGETASRHTGARGRGVMDMLLYAGDAAAVSFLYSGDGPTTGARGRYMYLILDARDCIVHHGWVDGRVYDRVIAPD